MALGWLRAFALVCLGLLASAPGARAALAKYESAVRRRPKDLRLRFLLGRKYAAAGKIDKALRQYRAILREKELPTVMFQMGLAHAKRGDLTNAVLSWTPILEKKPNNTKTMGYLGLALYKQGLQSPNTELRDRLFQESLDWWKRILKIDPSNLRARYFAGIEYFKLGRYEDAARQWLIFLRVKRNNAKVLALLGKALLKLGKWDKAQRTLDLLSSLPAAKNPKIDGFLRKAYRQIDQGKGGAPVARQVQLDRDEVRDDAVTRPPRPLPPEGPEPPPPPPLGEVPRPKPPSDDMEDEGDSLQAETLFLDGLEYREKGNYEKALFAFLQALDIDPNFSQVYLQVGEVYLGLAKLAPTPDEFTERMRLAEDALEKVKKLSPGTLLAHAGQSKLVVVKRSQKLGFTGYHEQVAKKAVQDERFSEAFDEFVLLLSVKDFRPRIFFQLAALVPRLTEGNRQDLRFFLEELKNQHPGHALTAYLLSRVYLANPDDANATKLAGPEVDEAIGGFAKYNEVREAFATFASTPKSAPDDQYVLAKVMAKKAEHKAALAAIEKFLAAAPESHPFFRDGAKLKEQLSIALRPTQAGAARQDFFKEELRLIKRTVRESHLFFKETEDGVSQLSQGHLEDVARFRAIRVFVDNNPTHGLARFLLGWLLKRKAVGKRADGEKGSAHAAGMEHIDRVHLEHLADPGYHHQLGLWCMKWTQVDPDLEAEAERFFATARHILLAFGRTHDKSFAAATLKGARHWLNLGKTDKAEKLLELARRFDPANLQVHALRFDLTLEQGGFFAAFGGLWAWLGDVFEHLWIRTILVSDLAILLFRVFLAGLLGWAATLLLRYHGELHYMFSEFWKAKGMVLPLSLFMTVSLVVLLPTGFLLFVPFLCWPVMASGERRCYLALLLGLAVTPVFLPLSMDSHTELLRAYEALSSGELELAGELLGEPFDDDPTRLYMHSVLALRLGDMETAERTLEKLGRRDTASDGVLVNRGVFAARNGDYEAAEKYFTQALSRSPSNARALFNLSSLHSIRGDEDKSNQYRRWSETAAGGTLPLDELIHIPKEVTRLALLDQPLGAVEMAPYFDFYSTSNFFAFHGALLEFLTWLLLGGGLCGLLVFTRERMDVDFTEYRKREADLPALKARAWNHARGLNLVFPGLGMTFVGRPVTGTAIFLATATPFLLWLSGGGALSRRLFPTADLGPIPTLIGLALVAALGLHLLAQYLLWTRRDDVEAR